MEICTIVRQVLQQGRLETPLQERLARLVQRADTLDAHDYAALLDLRAALESGAVALEGPREFRNVMETMVAEEVDRRLAQEGGNGAPRPDRADVLAFALNRLPPLYATTEAGAQYQRQRARRELAPLIAEQVEEALRCARQRPARPTARRQLDDPAHPPFLQDVRAVLRRFAADYELPA
ncbi:MAG: late competence development ComFB family protein [Deferrisomatales bacterium]